LTVLDIIESEGLLLHAERTGAWLASSIEGLGLPQISHVRGRGLLRGVVLKEPISADIARRALKRASSSTPRGQTCCVWRRRW
jgi:acetylornithine/N-succinyldiaminopimelate aminotransferase